MSKLVEYIDSIPSKLIETQNLDEIFNTSGNLYQSIVIASKRANQISSELKNELYFKLEDLRKVNEDVEEVVESREQIELSKQYEGVPHPTLIATKELLDNKLEFRFLS